MDQSVSGIMSRQPVAVGMDERLAEVRKIFERLRFHHLLVVDDGRLYGVLSDRDLLKAISPNLGTVAETDRDAATLNKRVHQVMTRKPVTLPPAATIADAIDVFNTHRISCIPIVDGDGRPVGLLSWRDILKSIGKSFDP